jgi:hypothetical protein
MTRARLVPACLLAFLVAAPLAASEVLPLEAVRPGMVGVGRTVFEGSRIEEFKVEVIGVLPNIGPKQSLIIARLQGGPLEKSGVIAGMSGSPVFIDGKLVGAVAFGFPFSKETIAGITPFGEMVEATRTTAPRSAVARFKLPFGAEGPAQPLDRTVLLSAFPKQLPMLFVPPAQAGVGRLPLAPLPLPMVFSGFDSGTLDWARAFFSELGFAPLAGGGGGDLPSASLPGLAPGSPVGVSLIEGDLDLSVTGTVTDIDKERVYAFGHPFYNLGPTQFPMKKAYVYSVFPSLYQSWKISATGDAVGTMDQDRQTGVSGLLGPAPAMIPIEVTLATSRGQERHYAFRMVDDELLSPLLTYVSLLSVLQSNERAFGTASVRMDARLELAGGRDVSVEDFFSQEQPAQQAAALVAAPLAYLLANDFQRVRVERVSVSVSSYETAHRATLQRAWVDRSEPLRAGSRASLRLLLRTYRGESFQETVPLAIPASARPGSYSLLVADGPTLSGIEQRELRQPFVPKSLEQIIRAINGLRRTNRIYVRLLRPGEGAVVSGEVLPSLPPSVLSVLKTGDQGGAVIPVGSSSSWEFELPTAYAFSGSRTLPLTIER